jgi:hypothetical protein
MLLYVKIINLNTLRAYAIMYGNIYCYEGEEYIPNWMDREGVSSAESTSADLGIEVRSGAAG